MDKLEHLKSILRLYESVLIAFSGGVDSTFLLKVAQDTLGNKNVKAATARSESFPEEEFDGSVELTHTLGVDQIVFNTDELHHPSFSENSKDRCYFCKSELFSNLKEIADREGLKVICDGSTADDLNDYRPGTRARKELDVRSPLEEAGFTKEEIRVLSKEIGLSTWDKPSFACLASRFPYGERITEDKLKLVSKGEKMLRDLGFKQFRLRYHGNIARIEVAKQEMDIFSNPEIRNLISKSIKSLGFSYVALDIDGYRTGSMNEALEQKGHPTLPRGE